MAVERSARKDPSDELIFGLDWAHGGPNTGNRNDPGFLQGETISASTWSVSGSPGTLTTANPQFTNTVTTVLVSGGTAGVTYKLINKITMGSGEIAERSIVIQVMDL